MLNYIARRLAMGLVLLFAVCTISFFLLSIGSEDIARGILGAKATPADIARWNQDHGLDASVVNRYWTWLTHAVQGDLGQPWTLSQSVTEVLRARLGVTLTIVSIALVLSAVLSIVLGVSAAIFGGWIDRVVLLLGLIGFAVPSFLIAFGLVLVFSVQHPVFAATGWVPPLEDFPGFVKSATLPVIALTVGGIAGATAQIRGSMIDILQQDFVRSLRACGLDFKRVVFKHVLRNAAAPALSILGLQFVGMLGGAVVIEQIFAIPGLGPYGVQTVLPHDIPAVMGLVAVTAVIVVVVNLVVDIASASLNPKVRLS